MATTRTSMTPMGGVVTFNTTNRDAMHPFGGVMSEQLLDVGGATNPKGPFTHPFFGPFRGPIS